MLTNKTIAREVVAKPRIGRPTRAEAIRRHQALLDVALDMFLERGFEETTMEDIANTARMSKRTVYARYANKEELFKAAVKRATEQYIIPPEELKAKETDDIESTLKAVAHRRFENLASPTGRKLYRILTTQACRFPELSLSTMNEGSGTAIAYLSDLFSRFEARGDIVIEDHQRTAVAFLSMVVGPPARIITTGNTLSKRELKKSIDFSVRLFLNGIRPR